MLKLGRQKRHDARMKMPEKTYRELESALMSVLGKSAGDSTVLENARAQYARGDFPRADKCKDVNMRFRWDCFWYALKLNRAAMPSFSDPTMKDPHIDTALKRIIGDVK